MAERIFQSSHISVRQTVLSPAASRMKAAQYADHSSRPLVSLSMQ